jgi:hypothetical protein
VLKGGEYHQTPLKQNRIMKLNHVLAVLTLLSATLLSSHGQNWITCTNSGSWGDTNIWDSNTVPGTNDFVEIDPGFTVTVDTNAIVLWIIGNGLAGGTLTMAPNSTLEVLDSSVSGTYQLGLLDATAPGNTVIYDGNPFYAKHCDYYNLVFYNTTTNNNDFYNGLVGPLDPAYAMTISGDMTVIGKTKVQQGDDFIIRGNLLLDTNAQWDCSLTNLTVMGNLTIGAGALFFDLDGADGSNYIGGNVTVSSSAIGWNVSDVITWGVGGSLTNNGTIVGKGYGSISFDGTGVIAGSKAIKIPTMTINGTYTIANNITVTTNTPSLNGTLIFDLVNTNKIIQQYVASTNQLPSYTNMYLGGNLEVINSGSAPVAGNVYQLFSANSYAGGFASTNFPSLPAGLSWVDNTLTSGSIAVTGAILGSPTLTLARSGGTLTLSWDSTTFPGFSVQGQTNITGIHTNWGPTTSGTVSPFMIAINPTNPPVFFRLSNQ